MLKIVPDPPHATHSLEDTLIQALVMCCLGWPIRGHARSHRISTGLKACTVPVGAGEPAKRPARRVENYQGIEQ